MAEIGETERGFTLVELLVVIAIIALLLSILMPSLNRVRESAKSVVCRTNLRQQGVALLLYSNENSDVMISEEDGHGTGHSRPWMAIMLPYIGRNEPKNLGAAVWDNDGAIKIFKCPSYKDPFVFDNTGVSYGINIYYTTHIDYNTGKTGSFVNRTRIRQPSKRMYVADSMDYLKPISPDLLKEYRLVRVPVRMTSWLLARYFGGMYDMPVADRHNGGSNILFVDNHTDLMKFTDIWPKLSDPKDTLDKKGLLWGYK
jgi:prepilin-type N-terminal cleavage/methylation domain-containing protein/prepilin-type processing-associated H-X9-DG protein